MNKWLNSIQTNKKVTFLFCMNCVGGKFLISKNELLHTVSFEVFRSLSEYEFNILYD